MQKRIQKKPNLLARSAMIHCAALLLALWGLSACLLGCGSDEGGSDGASGSSAAGGSSGTGGASGSSGTSGSGGVADGGSSAGSGGSAGDTGGLGQPCYSNETCDEPYVCEDGTCVEPAPEEGGLGQPCYSNGTCDAPYVCEGGWCVQLHDFTGLPLTADGWTDFRYMIEEQNLYQDARVVFISSSDGNDATGQVYGVDNLAFDQYGIFQPTGPINAYATLSAGASQLRDGYPDIMLLKRGDEWIETLSHGNRSGRSQVERAIYATYGTATARPTLRPYNRIVGSCDYWRNVIIAGIRVYGADRDPDHPDYREDGAFSSAGIRIIGGGQQGDLLLEDLHLEFARLETHSTDGSTLTNLAMRRCIHEKYYTLGTDHAGLNYIGDWDGILLEENFFYHGGWREDRPQDVTIFRRNNYQQTGQANSTFRYNFSIKGATEDQFRSGADLIGNVWARMPAGPYTAGGDAASKNVAYNVGLETTDNMGEVGWRGASFDFDGKNHVLENITANSIIDSPQRGWVVGAAGDITFERNIITNHGSYSLQINSNAPAILLIGNEFDNRKTNDELVRSATGQIVSSENNKFYSSQVANQWMRHDGSLMSLSDWQTAVSDTTSIAEEPNYPDPNRSLATYNASLGFGETFDAFVDELRKQSRANWREEFTARSVINYIREGFGRGSIPEDY